jgi:hypothetical protein
MKSLSNYLLRASGPLLGATLVLSVVFNHVGPRATASTTDCANLTVATEPYTLGYNADDRTVDIEYADPVRGNVVVTVDASDPVCRTTPGVGEAIASALAAYREDHAEFCDEIRSNFRRGVTRVGGQNLDLVAGEEFLAERCGEEVEQQWELLAEDPGPIHAAKEIPLQRGALPRSTTRFDPSPTATLEVVAKVTGAVGAGRWRLQLREGRFDASLVLSEIEFGPGDTEFVLRSSAIGFMGGSGFVGWPSSRDWFLDSLWATPIAPVGSGAGALEIKKAHVRIRQEEPVQATVGHFQIGTKQTVTGTDWVDLVDPIIYRHSASAFSPSPNAILRIGGISGASTGQARLVDASGTPAGSAVVIDVGAAIGPVTPGESVEAPVTLTDGHEYRLQVRASGAGTWQLLNADIELRQATTAATLDKTVGWFSAINLPATIPGGASLSGYQLRGPLSATYASYSWEATARLAAGDRVGLGLFNLTDQVRHASLTATATQFVRLESSIVDVPLMGQLLTPDSTPTGSARVSGATLRVTWDLPPPAQYDSNVAPDISTASIADPTVQVGEVVEFTVSWSDSNDDVAVIICRSSAIDTGTCTEGTWARLGGVTSPATVQIIAPESLVGTHDFYAFVCDSAFACDGPITGSFTIS